MKLHNFKRFRDCFIGLQPERNLLIGDNESGKSSILQAIDLVLSGSRSRVESIALENLMNIDAISSFLSSDRKYERLPEMFIEVYLNEQNNPDLNGRNNSNKTPCDGLSLVCSPMDEYSADIVAALANPDASFPFEYYSIKFRTFSGEPYGGYGRYLRHLLLDSSQINNEYATREYVKSVYRANSDDGERNKHQNEYRRHKSKFTNVILADVNDRLDTYKFSVSNGSKLSLEAGLTITENEVSIENKGKGRQCFIKTEFALKKGQSKSPLDVLLLEEPENHLSHTNMKRLVSTIAQSENQQMIVTTHSSLICARLDLRNATLLNSSAEKAANLKDISKETADFFMKAPDNNALELVLSKRVMLVEGDAEYILMQALFRRESGKDLDATDVHVISVGGTSFKRYMELAKILGIRLAVIRDNDGDHKKNCIDNYSEYVSENMKVFSETDNNLSTFEISIYHSNTALCNEAFTGGGIKLSPQEHMLHNKTKVALHLLEVASDRLVTPGYIKDAIQWITT